MPDPYYVRDMEYNVILWPEAIQKLTGYSEAEAKRTNAATFSAPTLQGLPYAEVCHERQVSQGRPGRCVPEGRHQTDHARLQRGRLHDEGEPIGAVEIVKDYTAYNGLVMKIASSTEHLSAMAEELAASSEEVTAMSQDLNKRSMDVAESAV